MPSLKLDPEVYIYAPPTTIYGGVIIKPGNTLLSDLRQVIKQTTDSIYQAYEINSYLASNNKVLESITENKNNTLNDKCRDYITDKTIIKLIQKLQTKGKEQGILIDEKEQKIHFIQILTEKFIPEDVRNLLTAIEQTILLMTGNKYEITNNIGSYIKIRTELKNYDEYFI